MISLGIGDPDTPTYPPIVAAAQEAVADPEYPPLPVQPRPAEFRRAVAEFYARRFGVELDPETEVMPAIGAKECIFNLNLAFLDPGDVALAADPGYPVYTGGPLLAGARLGADAAAARARVRARPRRDLRRRPAARAADVLQLSEQPDRGGRARRGCSSASSSSPGPTTSSPSTTTPTARRRTTATSRPRSWPPRAPRRSESRCSRSPRATT